MKPLKKSFAAAAVLFLAVCAYAAPVSTWVSLDSDSKSRLKKTIQSEVENREGYSTSEENQSNLRLVEEEIGRETSAYKSAIASANREFVRSKKRRDDLTAQFQAATYDFEEVQKNIKTIRAGIENLNNQIGRYEQDIKTQQESLKKWLKTEKQGEALVAVIYTRGFKDKTHDLDGLADQVSAPLMAQYMGTYIQSFTKVIDNVLSVDFIRAIEEGTAKWNNEEPMRIELEKGNQGTTYLRLKRYELYPFQESQTERIPPGASAKRMKATIITSMKDLESFLTHHKYSPKHYDLGQVTGIIKETDQGNAQAEEAMKEQMNSFQDRISALKEKIAGARSERQTQNGLLKNREFQHDKMQTDLDALRIKNTGADKAFQDAQSSLHEIKRIHESIIVKTALATTRGSQTPAEVSAEAIIDKLEEVRNDARTQHSSSTTEVTNFQVTGESSTQAVTEAKIIGVRLISFINEGDSVRVKMAFRVRTALEEKKQEKGFFDSLFGSEKDEELPPKVAERKPAPKPAIKKEAPPESPVVREDDKPEPAKIVPAPAPPPKRNVKALASGEGGDFLFELTGAKKTGNEITLMLEATNQVNNTKHLAVYDETSRYAKSSITDESGKTHPVGQVYLWQGEKKISSQEADRGIPVEPGESVTLQLIFKKIPSNIKTLKLFNFHPYTATRIVFFKWNETDVPFRNIRLRR